MRSLLLVREEDQQSEIAVELYFDGATEEAILELRNGLYEEGIVPDPGIIEARPHISLTILEGDEIPFELLQTFAGETGACKVRLTSLSAFAGSAGVLFLAPTPDDRLLGLHRDLLGRLRNSAYASRHAYEPDVWVPHCTLEKDIPAAQMGRAFAALLGAFEPIEGTLVEVGAVRYPPLEAVEIAPLSGESEVA